MKNFDESKSKGTESLLSLLLVASIVSVVLGFALWQYSESSAFLAPAIVSFLAFFLSLISLLGAGFERKAFEEAERISERARTSDIFSSDSTPVGDRGIAFERFEKKLLPVLCLLMILFEGGASYFLWRKFGLAASDSKLSWSFQNGPVFLAGLCAFALFIIGNYSSSLAFSGARPRLRAASAMTVLSSFAFAYTILCSALANFAKSSENIDFRSPDPLVLASGALLLLAIFADHLLGFILYFYRPPLSSAKYPPIYESRVASFISRPLSALDEINEILDYQFGVRISISQIGIFSRKVFIPLLIFQIISLFILSCIVVVPSQKRVFIERLGKPMQGDLVPGLHLKLPWPIDVAIYADADKIFSFECGSLLSSRSEEAGAGLMWGDISKNAPLFLTRADKPSAASSPERGESGRGISSVGLMAVEAVVRYSVDSPRDLLYSSLEPEKILKSLAENALASGISGTDAFALICGDSSRLGSQIADKINAESTKLGLGVSVRDVIFRRFQPPAKGEAVLSFHKAMIEEQNSLTAINDAEGYANMILPSAQISSDAVKSEAKSYASSRVNTAKAYSETFASMLELHRKHAKLYDSISYLDRLVKALARPSKLVMATDIKSQVMSLDLKDSFNPELLDLGVMGKKD